MNSYKKRLLVIVAAGHLLFPTLALAACPNLEGLYEKRRELRGKYERDFFKSREMTDKYMSQIQTIDQKYRNVIHQMFYEHERKEYNVFRKCCVGPIKDGYLFFVCKLIRYYNDGNANHLLNDLPVGKDKLTDLWQIDYILSDVKPRPQIFDKSSFVFLFLGAIYQLATEGNAKAIDKFLAINLFADGLYREYTEDEILKLFENRSETVIKNWNIIVKYKSSFRNSEFQFKASALIKQYQALCLKSNIAAPSVCKEIIEFFEAKDKGQ